MVMFCNYFIIRIPAMIRKVQDNKTPLSSIESDKRGRFPLIPETGICLLCFWRQLAVEFIILLKHHVLREKIVFIQCSITIFVDA